MAGKPVIKGTGLSVDLVLEYLSHTVDLDELLADYPELTREDVQAVFAVVGAGRLLEDVRQPGRLAVARTAALARP